MFVRIWTYTVLFFSVTLLSGSFAEGTTCIPTLPSVPNLPSVQAFGTPNPPVAKEAIKVMPRLLSWKEDIQTENILTLDPRNTHFAWPVLGKVSSGYGLRGKGSRVRMHQGIDIPVPKGTPIQASGSGVVLEARVYNGYGKTVILDHGNGTKTLYAHCSELLVKQGEQVELGQVIAYVGDTGRATTAHVHFGVMVAGTFRDPSALLKNRSQQFAKKR